MGIELKRPAPGIADVVIDVPPVNALDVAGVVLRLRRLLSRRAGTLRPGWWSSEQRAVDSAQGST